MKAARWLWCFLGQRIMASAPAPVLPTELQDPCNPSILHRQGSQAWLPLSPAVSPTPPELKSKCRTAQEPVHQGRRPFLPLGPTGSGAMLGPCTSTFSDAYSVPALGFPLLSPGHQAQAMLPRNTLPRQGALLHPDTQSCLTPAAASQDSPGPRRSPKSRGAGPHGPEDLASLLSKALGSQLRGRDWHGNPHPVPCTVAAWAERPSDQSQFHVFLRPAERPLGMDRTGTCTWSPRLYHSHCCLGPGGSGSERPLCPQKIVSKPQDPWESLPSVSLLPTMSAPTLRVQPPVDSVGRKVNHHQASAAPLKLTSKWLLIQGPGAVQTETY